MTVGPEIVSEVMENRDRLRVLVVGSGAREHALVWALSRSPSVKQLWAMPGNPGIASIAQIVDIPVTDVEHIADWADEHSIGLVVVGPEAPLALGLADRLIERGIPVFGPTRAAAELEWSKSYAKDFMRRHGIPTAPYGVFSDLDDALELCPPGDLCRWSSRPMVWPPAKASRSATRSVRQKRRFALHCSIASSGTPAIGSSSRAFSRAKS